MNDRKLSDDEARRLRDQVIMRPPGGGGSPPPQHMAGDPGCFLVLWKVLSFVAAFTIGLVLAWTSIQ